MKAAIPLITCALVAGSLAAAADPLWIPLPGQAPSPASNPTTPEKVDLGRILFHDKRLSESATVSCASCHSLKDGGADHRPVSIGVHGDSDGRNAPTVWNVGFLTSLFWDGRAANLEDQAIAQMLNPIDMGMKDVPYVTARLRSIPGYRSLFERAFGSGEVVTAENAAKALAAFERTLVTNNTPYDRYAAGDKSALTEPQVRGANLFRSAGCTRCHQGPAFDNPGLAAGVAFTMKFPTNPISPYVASYRLAQDQGRFEWSDRDADRFQWRVPSLRNLTYTAPYMHNGSVPTLAHAVRIMGSTELGRTFTDAEAGDLVAFLEALSGPLPEVATPALP